MRGNYRMTAYLAEPGVAGGCPWINRFRNSRRAGMRSGLYRPRLGRPDRVTCGGPRRHPLLAGCVPEDDAEGMADRVSKDPGACLAFRLTLVAPRTSSSCSARSA